MNATPYSEEAEKAVIGCMIAHPAEVMKDVEDTLSRDDFFVPAHQEIFEAIRYLDQSGIPVDVMTLHQRLSDRKIATAVGSPSILGELLVGFATHLNVASYVKTVKEKSLLRRLGGLCQKTIEDIAGNEEVDAIVDEAQASIFSLSRFTLGDRSVDANACCDEFLEHLDQIQQGICESRVQTGLGAIDRINGGFPKPGFVVIGGPQGGGKSALMLTLMENWCKADLGVGVFSIEMTRKAIMQRKVASVGRLDSRLMNSPLNEQAIGYVHQAVEQIRGWKFFINSESNLTLQEIRSQCRQWVRKGISIVELDYIQLVASKAKEDRRNQLVEISRGIAGIAKDLNITFVCLAQINREGAKTGNFKTSDLADCKAIGDDARVVILLEEKSGYVGPIDAVPLIARVDKYSEGERHDAELTFNKREQRIQ